MKKRKKKWCPRCQRNRAVAFFGLCRSRADGLAFYCRNCARDKQRAWVRRNRRKWRLIVRRSYSRHADVRRAMSKRYYWTNAEGERERQRTYRRKNLSRANAAVRRWRLANPDAVRNYIVHRRARSLGASGSFTKADVVRIAERQRGRCYYCGRRRKLTIDHKVALARGGSNRPSNLVLACKPCNSRKGIKTAKEFMRST